MSIYEVIESKLKSEEEIYNFEESKNNTKTYN